MSVLRNQLPRLGPTAHDIAMACVVHACQLVGALIFATQLPWQLPISWFVMSASVGILRTRHVGRSSFRALPREQRRRVRRIYIWAFMASVGSACWFLYVPADLHMQALLATFLLGHTVLFVARASGDFIRTAVALCLATLPTAVRFTVEGYQTDTVLLLLGLEGVLATVGMVLACRLQERSASRDYELRRRAESAASSAIWHSMAKSHFLASVSHDLRQATYAMGLHLDPLIKLSHTVMDKSAQDAAECVRASCRTLDDLLSQVLDLARIDMGAMKAELRSTAVAPLVRGAIMQHLAVAERVGVRMVALVEPNAWVMADEVMLRRVLSNLLDNAIAFSRRGSTVAVALRYAPNAWRLQVRDAGMGIAKDAQSRIFEEFVQISPNVRRHRRGTGLGLAISRRLVLLMGGNIAVRSDLGRGCCMTVTLQTAERPMPHGEGQHLPTAITQPK